MSAYITLATPIADQECLLLALSDLGFPANRVEVHQTAVPLVGYEGHNRSQHAHVVIRRTHVGAGSNDLGFERTSTGFRSHISDFDRTRYGTNWLRRLHDRYQHHDAAKQERIAQMCVAAEAEARRRAEIEAQQRAEERRRLVEAQCRAVQEKARKMGYRVEETRQGDTLRLVLVKRVY